MKYVPTSHVCSHPRCGKQLAGSMKTGRPIGKLCVRSAAIAGLGLGGQLSSAARGVGPLIQRFGTKEQKRTYLPGMLTGDVILACLAGGR